LTPDIPLRVTHFGIAGAVVNNGFFNGWDSRTMLVAASWCAKLSGQYTTFRQPRDT